MKLTKDEIRDIRRYYPNFDADNLENPKGKEIKIIIAVCKGQKIIHDSGYPFIKCIGVSRDEKEFYNLGLYDHIMFWCSVNVDTLGKNIFHYYSKGNTKKGLEYEKKADNLYEKEYYNMFEVKGNSNNYNNNY